MASSQTAGGPKFEVASVRALTSSSGRFTMNGGPGTNDPGRITYTNVPLRIVLLRAFDIRNYQLVGPDWLDTQRFDITAKVPDGASKDEFQAMLQNLLVTRYQMAIRKESKEVPIYALAVGKGGPKIQPAAQNGSSGGQPGTAELATILAAEGKDGFPTVSLRAPGLIIETKDGRLASARRTSPWRSSESSCQDGSAVR